MSATDDLRDRLAQALYAHRLSVGDFPDGTTAWDDLPEPWRDEWRDAADALVSVEREALAEAWDEGAQACYEWQVGVTGKPGNPWREDDQ